MLSASLGLAIVGAAAPARADVCFEYTVSGGGLSVAIGAKVPVFQNTCERVTIVSMDGGVATGSICMSAGQDTLVLHYVFDGCLNEYFEAATCRIGLENQTTLPTKEPTFQPTSCTGVYAGLVPGQSSPLNGFNYLNDLKAWTCTPAPLQVLGGGGGQCHVKTKGAPK
jgi:hypothetical protein